MSDGGQKGHQLPGARIKSAAQKRPAELELEAGASLEQRLARAIRNKWQIAQDEVALSAFVQSFPQIDQLILQVVLVRELGIERTRRVCALAGATFRLTPVVSPTRAELETLRRAELLVRGVTHELDWGLPVIAVSHAVSRLYRAPEAVRQTALKLLARRENTSSLSTLGRLNEVVEATGRPERYSVEQRAIGRSFGSAADGVEIEYSSPLVGAAKGVTVDGKVHVPWQRGHRLTEDQWKTLGHEVPHAIQQRQGGGDVRRWISPTKRRRLEQEARQASRAFLRGERFDVRGRAPQAVALYRGKVAGKTPSQVAEGSFTIDRKEVEIVPLSGAEIVEAGNDLRLFTISGKGFDKRWLSENSRSQFRFEWSCARMRKVAESKDEKDVGDPTKGEFHEAEKLLPEGPSTIANRDVKAVTPYDRQIWRYGGFRFRSEGMHTIECRIMLFQDGVWREWFVVNKDIMAQSVRWHQEQALKKGKDQVKDFATFVREAKDKKLKEKINRRLLKEGEAVYSVDDKGKPVTEKVWLIRGEEGDKERFRTGEKSWFQVVGLKPLGPGQSYRCSWLVHRVGAESSEGARVADYDSTSRLQTPERLFEAFEFSKPGRYRVQVDVTANVGKQTAHLTNVTHIDRNNWLIYEFDVAASGTDRQRSVQSTGPNPAVIEWDAEPGAIKKAFGVTVPGIIVKGLSDKPRTGYPENEADLKARFLMGYGLVKPRGTKQVWFAVPQLSMERTPKDYWGWKYLDIGEAGKKYPELQNQSIGPWKDAGVAPMYEAPYTLGPEEDRQVWFPMYDRLLVPKGENTIYMMCLELDANGKVVEVHRFMQRVWSKQRADEKAWDKKKLVEANELESKYIKNLATCEAQFESLTPLHACYVNREQKDTRVVTVPLYYGKLKATGTIAILDATPDSEAMRLDRRVYDGKGRDVNAAIWAYASGFSGSHDFYPTGEMLINFGGAAPFHFKTLGVTTFTKWLSVTGLAALVLTVAGMVASFVPPLAPAAPFLFAAAGALGAVSAIGDVYQQSLAVEGLTEGAVALAIISIASSLVGFGKAGFTLLKQIITVLRAGKKGSTAVRLVRNLLAIAKRSGRQHAELVGKMEALLVQLNRIAVVLDAVDTTTSVAQVKDFYEELSKILEDPTTASEQRLWDLLGSVQRFGLNFVMSGMGAAGIKGDFKEAFAHHPAHKSRPARKAAESKPASVVSIEGKTANTHQATATAKDGGDKVLDFQAGKAKIEAKPKPEPPSKRDAPSSEAMPQSVPVAVGAPNGVVQLSIGSQHPHNVQAGGGNQHHVRNSSGDEPKDVFTGRPISQSNSGGSNGGFHDGSSSQKTNFDPRVREIPDYTSMPDVAYQTSPPIVLEGGGKKVAIAQTSPAWMQQLQLGWIEDGTIVAAVVDGQTDFLRVRIKNDRFVFEAVPEAQVRAHFGLDGSLPSVGGPPRAATPPVHGPDMIINGDSMSGHGSNAFKQTTPANIIHNQIEVEIVPLDEAWCYRFKHGYTTEGQLVAHGSDIYRVFRDPNNPHDAMLYRISKEEAYNYALTEGCIFRFGDQRYQVRKDGLAHPIDKTDAPPLPLVWKGSDHFEPEAGAWQAYLKWWNQDYYQSALFINGEAIYPVTALWEDPQQFSVGEWFAYPGPDGSIFGIAIYRGIDSNGQVLIDRASFEDARQAYAQQGISLQTGYGPWHEGPRIVVDHDDRSQTMNVQHGSNDHLHEQPTSPDARGRGAPIDGTSLSSGSTNTDHLPDFTVEDLQALASSGRVPVVHGADGAELVANVMAALVSKAVNFNEPIIFIKNTSGKQIIDVMQVVWSGNEPDISPITSQQEAQLLAMLPDLQAGTGASQRGKLHSSAANTDSPSASVEISHVAHVDGVGDLTPAIVNGWVISASRAGRNSIGAKTRDFFDNAETAWMAHLCNAVGIPHNTPLAQLQNFLGDIAKHDPVTWQVIQNALRHIEAIGSERAPDVIHTAMGRRSEALGHESRTDEPRYYSLADGSSRSEGPSLPRMPASGPTREWQTAWCDTMATDLDTRGVVYTRRYDRNGAPYLEITPLDAATHPTAHRENHRAANVRRTLNLSTGYAPPAHYQAQSTLYPERRFISLATNSVVGNRHEFEHGAGLQGRSSLYDVEISAHPESTIPTMAKQDGYSQFFILDEFVTHSGDLAFYTAVLQKHAANIVSRMLAGETISSHNKDLDVEAVSEAKFQINQILGHLTELGGASAAIFKSLPQPITEGHCQLTSSFENGVPGVVVTVTNSAAPVKVSLWGEPYVSWYKESASPENLNLLVGEVNRRIARLAQSVETTLASSASLKQQMERISTTLVQATAQKSRGTAMDTARVARSLSERANHLPSNPETFDPAWFDKRFWQTHDVEHIAIESLNIAKQVERLGGDAELIARAHALSQTAEAIWRERDALSADPAALAKRLSALGVESRVVAAQAQSWLLTTSDVPTQIRDLDSGAKAIKANARDLRQFIKRGDRDPNAQALVPPKRSKPSQPEVEEPARPKVSWKEASNVRFAAGGDQSMLIWEYRRAGQLAGVISTDKASRTLPLPNVPAAPDLKEGYRQLAFAAKDVPEHLRQQLGATDEQFVIVVAHWRDNRQTLTPERMLQVGELALAQTSRTPPEFALGILIPHLDDELLPQVETKIRKLPAAPDNREAPPSRQPPVQVFEDGQPTNLVMDPKDRKVRVATEAEQRHASWTPPTIVHDPKQFQFNAAVDNVLHALNEMGGKVIDITPEKSNDVDVHPDDPEIINRQTQGGGRETDKNQALPTAGPRNQPEAFVPPPPVAPTVILPQELERRQQVNAAREANAKRRQRLLEQLSLERTQNADIERQRRQEDEKVAYRVYRENQAFVPDYGHRVVLTDATSGETMTGVIGHGSREGMIFYHLGEDGALVNYSYVDRKQWHVTRTVSDVPPTAMPPLVTPTTIENVRNLGRPIIVQNVASGEQRIGRPFIDRESGRIQLDTPHDWNRPEARTHFTHLEQGQWLYLGTVQGQPSNWRASPLRAAAPRVEVPHVESHLPVLAKHDVAELTRLHPDRPLVLVHARTGEELVGAFSTHQPEGQNAIEFVVSDGRNARSRRLNPADWSLKQVVFGDLQEYLNHQVWAKEEADKATTAQKARIDQARRNLQQPTNRPSTSGPEEFLKAVKGRKENCDAVAWSADHSLRLRLSGEPYSSVVALPARDVSRNWSTSDWAEYYRTRPVQVNSMSDAQAEVFGWALENNRRPVRAVVLGFFKDETRPGHAFNMYYGPNESGRVDVHFEDRMGPGAQQDLYQYDHYVVIRTDQADGISPAEQARGWAAWQAQKAAHVGPGLPRSRRLDADVPSRQSRGGSGKDAPQANGKQDEKKRSKDHSTSSESQPSKIEMNDDDDLSWLDEKDDFERMLDGDFRSQDVSNLVASSQVAIQRLVEKGKPIPAYHGDLLHRNGVLPAGYFKPEGRNAQHYSFDPELKRIEMSEKEICQRLGIDELEQRQAHLDPFDEAYDELDGKIFALRSSAEFRDLDRKKDQIILRLNRQHKQASLNNLDARYSSSFYRERFAAPQRDLHNLSNNGLIDYAWSRFGVQIVAESHAAWKRRELLAIIDDLHTLGPSELKGVKNIRREHGAVVEGGHYFEGTITLNDNAFADNASSVRLELTDVQSPFATRPATTLRAVLDHEVGHNRIKNQLSNQADWREVTVEDAIAALKADGWNESDAGFELAYMSMTRGTHYEERRQVVAGGRVYGFDGNQLVSYAQGAIPHERVFPAERWAYARSAAIENEAELYAHAKNAPHEVYYAFVDMPAEEVAYRKLDLALLEQWLKRVTAENLDGKRKQAEAEVKKAKEDLGRAIEVQTNRAQTWHRLRTEVFGIDDTWVEMLAERLPEKDRAKFRARVQGAATAQQVVVAFKAQANHGGLSVADRALAQLCSDYPAEVSSFIRLWEANRSSNSIASPLGIRGNVNASEALADAIRSSRVRPDLFAGRASSIEALGELERQLFHIVRLSNGINPAEIDRIVIDAVGTSPGEDLSTAVGGANSQIRSAVKEFRDETAKVVTRHQLAACVRTLVAKIRSAQPASARANNPEFDQRRRQGNIDGVKESPQPMKLKGNQPEHSEGDKILSAANIKTGGS